ncbi:MAG: LarC family nickel insertion protein [Planctomycetota bacterium]
MVNHLHIDPFSGIAGDMFLGALVDLGVPLDQVRAALGKLPVERPYEITTRRVYRHGIGAVDLKVCLLGEPQAASDLSGHHQHQHDHQQEHAHEQAHQHHGHAHGDGHHHHHTGYREIMGMVEQLDTTDRGRARAERVVTRLAEAEARVHGKSLDDIHFHEVGAVDSIVDMLGSVVALELLDIETLSCGPLPLNRGFVRCDHGMMPVPAPATAYLMADMPTVGVDRVGELVTPTGAALAAGLCGRFGTAPPMTLGNTGYGAGDRDTPDLPNLLRVMLGKTGEPIGPIQPH